MVGLLFRKDFGVGGLGGGRCGGDVNGDVKSEGDGGQAEFGAAGLVAEFQGDVLCAERRVCERGDGHAERHRVLVDVQRGFGKREFFELALGIDDFAAAEAGGKFGFEIGGDEIVFRFFTGVNVKARTVFSRTKALRESFQPSLKLVESAEIQISRTGVLGEITNLASSGSSKTTSSFPDSPSTSKPCSSPRASRRFLRSSKAASALR